MANSEPKNIIDSYHGLLSNPPGLWKKITYGAHTAVLLQGTSDFVVKAFNMFSSMGGGKLTPEHHNVEIKFRKLHENVYMVPITEERLRAALRMFFYGQIFQKEAKVTWEKDGEGEVINTTITNDADMMEEATRLADTFILTAMDSDIPVEFNDVEPFMGEEYRIID